ncbi:MAG: MaoC family dehydratase [Micromonosporaceae bacterium]|nr:MaoC family dehydratase [Micromonosporaceae bacterium]
MPIDPSYLGHSFASDTPYEVGREKIREFADAIGDPNPAYRDAEAAKALGHPDVIAPPTFPIVFTFAANLPLLAELGIELRNIVHGEQRFQYARPIRPGDRLACAVTVENVRPMAGDDFLTTRADISAADGEHVVSAWSTIIARPEPDAPEADSGEGR